MNGIQYVHASRPQSKIRGSLDLLKREILLFTSSSNVVWAESERSYKEPLALKALNSRSISQTY